MNSDTGKAYAGAGEVAAAVARGEKLVPISQRAATNIKLARAARAEKLLKQRRSKRSAEKRSRKANRRSR